MTTTTTRRRLLGALAGAAAAAVSCGVLGKRLETLAAREATEQTLLAVGQGIPQVRPPTPQRTTIADWEVEPLARDFVRLMTDPAAPVTERAIARAMLVEDFGLEAVERRFGLPSWDDLLAEAEAVGFRVTEGTPLRGRVRAVLAYGSISLHDGLDDAQRRRLLAGALARPDDVDVFVDHAGGLWLMAGTAA